MITIFLRLLRVEIRLAFNNENGASKMIEYITFSEVMSDKVTDESIEGVTARFNRQIGQRITLSDKNRSVFGGLGLHKDNCTCVANDQIASDLENTVKQNNEMCEKEKDFILMAISESRELMLKDRTIYISYSCYRPQ